jgi:hypothetical protein
MRWIQFCSWEVKIIIIKNKQKIKKKAIRKAQKMKDQQNKKNWLEYRKKKKKYRKMKKKLKNKIKNTLTEKTKMTMFKLETIVLRIDMIIKGMRLKLKAKSKLLRKNQIIITILKKILNRKIAITIDCKKWK